MPSKIQVDQIAGATGSTVTLPSGQTLDLSSGTVTLPNSAVNLTTKVTGTLPVANGGTGLTTIGTANQVLRVNSGATSLEFGSLSSDFVKLYTVTQSSFVSSTVIDGYFDDTIYASYELHIAHMRVNSGSSNSQLQMNWYNAGSVQSSSDYRWMLSESYANGTSTTTGDNNRTGYNDSRWDQMNGTWSANADSSSTQQNYILYIFNPQDTNNSKHIISKYSGISGDGSRFVGTGYCQYNTTNSMSGLSFSNPNSWTHKARWTLYGKKK